MFHRWRVIKDERRLHVRTRWRALTIFFLTMAQAIAANAAAPMVFDRFDRDSGLSQLTVNTIAEDTTGFLWVGTEDGFDRFDGYSFLHASRDPSDPARLPNGFVADIAIDAQGALWLATDGHGVVRKDPDTGYFATLSDILKNEANLAGLERIRTLQLDRNGLLWMGSRSGAIARYDPHSGEIDRYLHPGKSVYVLFQDRDGRMWAGTELGLERFNPQTRAFELLPLPLPPSTVVRTIGEDRDGRLWVGTLAGLVKLEGVARTATLFRHTESNKRSLPSDTVNAVLEDRSGRLWVGTSAGLALLDRATGTFDIYRNDPADPRSLPDDNVFSLFEDHNGLLWVGTKFGGLAKWNPRTWSFGHHPARPEHGFASRNIMAITEDRSKRLWLGTFDGGIAVLDRATGLATNVRHRPGDPASLSDDRVMTLLADHQGVIWAGTMGGGLNRVDPSTRRATVFQHDPNDPRTLGAPGVMSVFEDSRHRLWVGTYGGGLSLLNRTTGQFTRYLSDPKNPTALSSDRVTAFAEDPSGLLWVGTDGGGLNLFDAERGTFIPFRHDPHNTRSLSADTVYAIHIDRYDRVWVGTRGGGLNHIVGKARNPKAIRFTHLSEQNGLPNDTIYGIESDAQGGLWVSTNYGIARVDPQRRKARAFHRAHGLQGDEFSYGAHFANARGELFFGGANGFNVFKPTQLLTNPSPPRIALTSYSLLNGAPIAGAAAARLQRLRLGYRDDTVSFEFSALDFAAPAANRYQFWLEGSNRGWVDTGTRRSVTYSNLPGGEYTLHVRASNADGVWNTAGFALALEIDPPPWKSAWAYAGYALFALLTLLAIWLRIRFRLVREARQREQLESLVRERTKELASHAQALELANQRLEEASFTDPLTGLGNRRSLKQTAPQMIAGMPRGGRLALMVVDLDRLKPINDEYGHEAGDRVLTHVSRILRDCLHGLDTVVRWGGDEFVVVHACHNLESASELAERIRIAVSTHRYRLAGNTIARTSCSIGFALYPFVRSAPGLPSWEDVLRMADAALYRAKSRRNAWVGWSGRRAAEGLAHRVVTDPEAAEIEGLIRCCSSDVTSGETIELILRRPAGRARQETGVP